MSVNPREFSSRSILSRSKRRICKTRRWQEISMQLDDIDKHEEFFYFVKNAILLSFFQPDGRINEYGSTPYLNTQNNYLCNKGVWSKKTCAL